MKNVGILVVIAVLVACVSVVVAAPLFDPPSPGSVFLWDPPAGATFEPGKWVDIQGKPETITGAELGVFPLGTTNFSTTPPIATVPVDFDGTKGVPVELVIAGQPEKTELLIAVRVKDDSGNWSRWTDPVGLKVPDTVAPERPIFLKLRVQVNVQVEVPPIEVPK